MADTQSPVPVPATDQSTRTLILVTYGLFLLALLQVTCFAAIIGVIIAYVKRPDVRGTVWESHVENQITTFWAGVILSLAGWLTIWLLGLGLLFWLAAAVYVGYRSIKGLIRANDYQAYV
jgi:uncharacterized membrane protein